MDRVAHVGHDGPRHVTIEKAASINRITKNSMVLQPISLRERAYRNGIHSNKNEQDEGQGCKAPSRSKTQTTKKTT